MSEKTDLLRPSRDGDQFHYLRGARLSLALLQRGSDLVAITVEGASDKDNIEEGTEVIDLALYYGSTDVVDATRIRYRQFKHSTLHAEDEWTASGLIKTLQGFAARYQKLVSNFDADNVARRFRFEFETNRPIAASVTAALADIANSEGATTKYLRKEIGLPAKALEPFVALVRLLPNSEGFLEHRALLQRDMRAYLPDNDKDAPLKLKDLVARKATSEFVANPMITRHDVIETIGTREGDLFPARLLIETPPDLVVRDQVGRIAKAVIEADAPLILAADAGVGKSVTATQLGAAMPAGSQTFVYDCFGNGGYRSASEYRHRARDGLVQIANEMATKGLCDLLVPTGRAEDSDYVRAFMARMVQADEAIMSKGSGALVLIVIDAADNAEMAASEAGDGRSFARLLLRENWPPHVRLMLTARPHRVEMLHSPPAARQLELLPFSEAETAAKLRSHFPNASDHDVREFHRLTSQNPRVQSTAIEAGSTLAEVLTALGPTPRSVEDTIGALLEQAVARVRDAAVGAEQGQIDGVCAALATLRPFVPLEVVAATANVPVSLVRSIALDLQRPLMVRADAVQFRDEPTETWFRDRFRPSQDEMSQFVARLIPLAASSAYVAAVLPQLVLEAGQFDDLVALALRGGALPETSEIARRDVELQRLQFAIKAALRAKRYVEAAKLAMKAGGEAAADERQQALLADNTDLAARFLEPNQLVEQVARRQIQKGAWTGSEHAYEAALLSGSSALVGDARSRLRLAYDWLGHWVRLGRTDRERRGQLEPEDMAEVHLAQLNLHGPAAAADALRSWRPRELSYQVGRLLVSRLIDAGRFAEVDELALAAGNDISLVLAVARELDKVGRLPPRVAVWRATRLACSRHVTLRGLETLSGENELLAALSALTAAAVRHRVIARPRLAAILGKYLPKTPPRGLGGRFANYNDRRATLMRAYTLRASLRRADLKVQHLADRDMRKQLKRTPSSQEGERFREDVGALLPWHRLLANVELARLDASLSAAIDEAKSLSAKAASSYYREDRGTEEEIAILWSKALSVSQAGATEWDAYDAWRKGLRTPLPTMTLAMIARNLGLAGQTVRALALAREAFDHAARTREDAESTVSTYVTIARAVLHSSEAEARHYFNHAIEVASRIGGENLSRWDALLHLAIASAKDGRDDPKIAYQLARTAELTYDFVARDKYFDWEASLETIARLSPRSSLAIASRWADRRFGRPERTLAYIVEQLRRDSALDARSALILLPLHAEWDLDDMVDAALAACPSLAEREHVAELFWRYARFMPGAIERWRRIDQSLARHGVIGVNVGPALARAERNASADDRYSYAPTADETVPFDWEGIFAGLDLGQASENAEALRRYKECGSGFYPERFFSEAMARVRPGEESRFLDALATLDLYQLNGLLEAIPDEWRQRIAVSPALQRVVRQVYRSETHRISANRHYQMLPLDRASEASGLAVDVLVGETVDAIGQTTVPTDAGDLFRLVGLLGLLLTPEEAREALSFGLELVEPSFDPKDGDGPWQERLMPPASVEESLAGYLWAGLAAPEARRRWEAAHGVRLAAALGRADILGHLTSLAMLESGGAFADEAFHFYRWHGRQWLAIALARAAMESGLTVASQQHWLKAEAAPECRHVLIRGFAGGALLTLEGQGLITLSPEEKDRLGTINTSPFPIRRPLKARQGHGSQRRRSLEDGFFFDLDFPKYVLAPLGRPFGIAEDAIELLAEKVIREDWGLEESGRWDSDARAMRKFFSDEWRRARGGDSPVDDLRSYLSHHAAMTLAGKLLSERPLRQEPDEDYYTFSRWLRDQGLTRADGRWIADQRDLTPVDAAELERIADDVDWSRSLTDIAVEAEIGVAPGRVAVSGHWTTFEGAHKQSVTVHSALVDPTRARALVRALQAIQDSHAYRLPNFEDHHQEIVRSGYVLKGWIVDRDQESGLDRHDPWAAGIPLRRLGPGALLPCSRLEPAPDGRSWRDATEAEQLWLENWSEARDEDDEKRNRGQRLVASRDLVDRLMREQGLSLIVEVDAKRQMTGQESTGWSQRDHDQQRTRILLFEPGQEPLSYRSPPRPRRKARRRARSDRA
ncbi:MAG TPA: NACHT domain-containing protein [Allosphingosinicella sp.]